MASLKLEEKDSSCKQRSNGHVPADFYKRLHKLYACVYIHHIQCVLCTGAHSFVIQTFTNSNLKVERNCIRCFSLCCESMPDQQQFKVYAGSWLDRTRCSSLLGRPQPRPLRGNGGGVHTRPRRLLSSCLGGTGVQTGNASTRLASYFSFLLSLSP